MNFDFDQILDRSRTGSAKWDKYAGRDILPFWVADMDFPTPEFIRDAVRARLDHPVLGYTRTPESLVNAFMSWLAREYGWLIEEDWLVWLPGVVPGVNLTAKAVAEPGGGIVIPTPVYYPFLLTPRFVDQAAITVGLVREGQQWVMDFDAMQAAVERYSGGRARSLLLANPQNPTGRAYRRDELEKLANFCIDNDLTLCADEIHSPIVLDGSLKHIPIASLAPEIAERTVTLYAPTKAYNMPGLPCAVAVIPNPELRRAFKRAKAGLVPDVGPLAYAAAEAAWTDESTYLRELLDYLQDNHERLLSVAGPRMTPVEATYLAWIDLTDTGIGERAGAHFETFGLGLSDGTAFGGPGFVRFNFACPRALLEKGLERLDAGLQALTQGAPTD